MGKRLENLLEKSRFEPAESVFLLQVEFFEPGWAGRYFGENSQNSHCVKITFQAEHVQVSVSTRDPARV